MAKDETTAVRERVRELEADVAELNRQADGRVEVMGKHIQECADAETERDEALTQRDALLSQARVWAGEAKTQRATVQEVGAILGGIPDWGPIAEKVGGLREERDQWEWYARRGCEDGVRGAVGGRATLESLRREQSTEPADIGLAISASFEELRCKLAEAIAALPPESAGSNE